MNVARFARSIRSCALALICLAACSSEHVRLVRDPTPDAGSRRDGGALDATPTEPATRDGALRDADGSNSLDASARSDASTPARCGKGPCACDDGFDNDGDGLIDGLD